MQTQPSEFNQSFNPITMPEIQQLSELHSQQIALLGYIMIEETKWYVYQKHRLPIALQPPGSVGHKIVSNHNKSVYYSLTTDQNKASRVK